MGIFMLDITTEQLKKCMPKCKEPSLWVELLNTHLIEFGIIEPRQIAMFIAQTGHESLDYNILEENLNYSKDGLLRTFPKYFRDVSPDAYARNPRKIASRVYANRMGNGSEESEDGWRFRGRGIIQITGYNNYAACSEYLYSDRLVLTDDPDILTEKKEALLSALWFWDINNLNNIHDVEKATRKINGGTHGLDDRWARYKTALSVLEIR